jgi:hypothetical protein
MLMGRFVGTPPPFKKVVVVSYSAFDTFVIPGQNEIEKDRLKEEGELFGYVYCGLRERGADIEDDFDRRAFYRLKTPEEFETEFLSALNLILPRLGEREERCPATQRIRRRVRSFGSGA